MLPLTQSWIDPPIASTKTRAGGPRGCSKAETMMLVSRTTRIMSPAAAGIHVSLCAQLQSLCQSHRQRADRGLLAWKFPRIFGATPVQDHAPRPAGHIARSRGHAPELWQLEPLFARREDQWSTSWHPHSDHINRCGTLPE